jgi:DNA invertase Pin-like site-specific DNA recombinase
MRKKMSHKLTKEQKEEILKLISEGFSPTDIAEKFGVSRITVYNISRKRKVYDPESK